MLSVGIDPGTITGYSILSSRNCNGFEIESSGVITCKDKDPIKRGDYIAKAIMEEIGLYFPRLGAQAGYKICIEGYGFTRVANLEPLFAIGTLIRKYLQTHSMDYITVPPTSLKKFVTGKGNSNKDIMIKELFKRFKIDTDNNNEGDAHGLALFGLAWAGKLSVPKTNMEAVEVVKHGR
jgi:crossover junction endodeoxyribonuclease RuvC